MAHWQKSLPNHWKPIWVIVLQLSLDWACQYDHELWPFDLKIYRYLPFFVLHLCMIWFIYLLFKRHIQRYFSYICDGTQMCMRTEEEDGPTPRLQRHRHFVGFLNLPVQAVTRGPPFLRLFRETAPFQSPFYEEHGNKEDHLWMQYQVCWFKTIWVILLQQSIVKYC